MNSHGTCHSFIAAINCGGLSSPSNGQISITDTTFGSIATYSCDPGYTLDGNTSRICQADGQWSGSQPSCNGEWYLLIIEQNMYVSCYILYSFIAIDCGDLSAPSNGHISITATTFGSVATYSCDLGYTLDGSTSRICQSNGQWSGSQPSCSGEWSLLIIKQNMYHATFCIVS